MISVRLHTRWLGIPAPHAACPRSTAACWRGAHASSALAFQLTQSRHPSKPGARVHHADLELSAPDPLAPEGACKLPSALLAPGVTGCCAAAEEEDPLLPRAVALCHQGVLSSLGGAVALLLAAEAGSFPLPAARQLLRSVNASICLQHGRGSSGRGGGGPRGFCCRQLPLQGL